MQRFMPKLCIEKQNEFGLQAAVLCQTQCQVLTYNIRVDLTDNSGKIFVTSLNHGACY